MRRPLKTGFLLASAALVAGCVSSQPAPVSDRSAPPRKTAAPPAVVTAAPAPGPRPADSRPDTYVVKPGDTLYSIALEHGLDYRELAIWNGIDNPGAIRVGQQLRLTAPASAVTTAPLRTPGGTVQAKPLGTGPTPTPVPATAAAPSAGTVVSEPKGVRVPYSDQALAQLSKAEVAAPARVEPPRADVRTETAPDTARGPDDLDWAWPVRGKIVATFNDASNKGIAIAGKLGQPVLASAPGRVIFSGSGIRGFGKLIVIKHNNTYLSVYAHNNELLVKEGQNVSKGQKIAEMGSTDADQVKLHFEIRRFGKPIDPLKLLPTG